MISFLVLRSHVVSIQLVGWTLQSLRGLRIDKALSFYGVPAASSLAARGTIPPKQILSLPSLPGSSRDETCCIRLGLVKVPSVNPRPYAHQLLNTQYIAPTVVPGLSKRRPTKSGLVSVSLRSAKYIYE